MIKPELDSPDHCQMIADELMRLFDNKASVKVYREPERCTIFVSIRDFQRDLNWGRRISEIILADHGTKFVAEAIYKECAKDFDDTNSEAAQPDPINPDHYKNHPSKVECIQITEHFNFCRGNAIKYLWRAGEKGDAIEDLRKARWYVDREIQRLEFIRKDKFRSEEILIGEGLEGIKKDA
jgi:hypothetical protein